MGGRIDPQRDGNRIDEHYGDDVELNGDRQSFGNFSPDGLIVFEGIAKFEREKIAQPAPILPMQWLVQPVLLAPGSQRLVYSAVSQSTVFRARGAQTSTSAQFRRIARGEMDDEKGNKRHPNKGGDEQEQALHKIRQHRVTPSFLLCQLGRLVALQGFGYPPLDRA